MYRSPEEAVLIHMNDAGLEAGPEPIKKFI